MVEEKITICSSAFQEKSSYVSYRRSAETLNNLLALLSQNMREAALSNAASKCLFAAYYTVWLVWLVSVILGFAFSDGKDKSCHTSEFFKSFTSYTFILEKARA